jgi:hypothetical protein
MTTYERGNGGEPILQPSRKRVCVPTNRGEADYGGTQPHSAFIRQYHG